VAVIEAEPYEAELLRPLPAATDDGNAWVDGWCWLWCGWRYTRVLWIGAVGTPGANSPLYACGPCIKLLHDSVWDYAETTQHWLPADEWGREIPLYQPVRESPPEAIRFRRGRHRRPRTPLGRRFLRATTAPDERRPPNSLPPAQPPETALPRADPLRRRGPTPTG
jgi:hypothetical protein